MELFGFQIGKKKEEEQKPTVQSFAPPPAEDGILTVTEGGFYGTAIDQDGTTKNETTLITRYRTMAQQPECERAIDDVINEAIVSDEHDSPVSIVFWMGPPVTAPKSTSLEMTKSKAILVLAQKMMSFFTALSFLRARSVSSGYNLSLDTPSPNRAISKVS